MAWLLVNFDWAGTALCTGPAVACLSATSLIVLIINRYDLTSILGQGTKLM